MTFVRLGSGDDGRDGGSWGGRGVSDIACGARVEARGVVWRGGERAADSDAFFWWGRGRRVQERVSLASWRGPMFPPSPASPAAHFSISSYIPHLDCVPPGEACPCPMSQPLTQGIHMREPSPTIADCDDVRRPGASVGPKETWQRVPGEPSPALLSGRAVAQNGSAALGKLLAGAL